MAELELKFQQNGSPSQTIGIFDVNLKAQTTTGLVKRLKKRSPGLEESVLEQIVDQIFVLGFKLYRAGEPVQEIDTDLSVPDLSFRLNPFVYDGYPP